VLVFYRGQWCPFCNKQLSKINDSLSFIIAKGATVLTITPETADNIKKTIEKTKASYSIIEDKGMSIMKNYKVNFAIDEDTIEKYKKYGIDFDKANGTNGANLPVPATYIISKDGKIKYAFFNPDYRQRPSVKEILDNL
jgi:peroxiredoxin